MIEIEEHAIIRIEFYHSNREKIIKMVCIDRFHRTREQ